MLRAVLYTFFFCLLGFSGSHAAVPDLQAQFIDDGIAAVAFNYVIDVDFCHGDRSAWD